MKSTYRAWDEKKKRFNYNITVSSDGIVSVNLGNNIWMSTDWTAQKSTGNYDENDNEIFEPLETK